MQINKNFLLIFEERNYLPSRIRCDKDTICFYWYFIESNMKNMKGIKLKLRKNNYIALNYLYYL